MNYLYQSTTESSSGIVGFLVAPIVPDLVGHGLLVQFDAEARTLRHFQKSLANAERAA